MKCLPKRRNLLRPAGIGWDRAPNKKPPQRTGAANVQADCEITRFGLGASARVSDVGFRRIGLSVRATHLV
jgi:hypothetical protein